MSRRSAVALFAAALCAGLALAVWALVFRTGIGRAADVAAFNGFVHLQETPAAPVASLVAALCNPKPYAVLAAAVLLGVLVRRGPWWALAAGAVLLVSNVISQVLKPALAAPRMPSPLSTGAHVIAESWPSGHATAAMALALMAVIAAPPARRRLVAVLGGLFAVAVAYSVVLLGWHLPSDALGGFAVAGATASLAMAGMWALDARRPDASRRRLAEERWAAGTARRAARRAWDQPTAAAAATLAVVAIVLLRVASWLPGAEHQAAFLALAAAIVVLGFALAVVAAGAERA